MSAQTLAERYGEATHTPITARWILKMEQQNKVPTDITRRRILANILEIPALLFGLASLETATYQPPVTPQAPVVLTHTTLDLERYSKDAHLFWKLHYAQTASDTLPDLVTTMKTLLPIHQNAKGDLARQLSELLTSYYRLAATLQRDRGDFDDAYCFANESVRLAKTMGNDPYARQLLAASQYTRGIINLAWGAFGNQVKQGTVILQQEKLEAALIDFEQALKQASPQLKGIIYSEMARAKALTATSPTDMTITLKLMEQAEQFVEVDSTDDFYTQIMVNGDLKGLDNRRLDA
jgi:tetratricopeptide (TPR) repeat protein